MSNTAILSWEFSGSLYHSPNLQHEIENGKKFKLKNNNNKKDKPEREGRKSCLESEWCVTANLCPKGLNLYMNNTVVPQTFDFLPIYQDITRTYNVILKSWSLI